MCGKGRQDQRWSSSVYGKLACDYNSIAYLKTMVQHNIFALQHCTLTTAVAFSPGGGGGVDLDRIPTATPPLNHPHRPDGARGQPVITEPMMDLTTVGYLTRPGR